MQLVLLICYHFQHMITYLLKRFLREKQKKICVRVIPHGLLKHRKSQMRQRQKRTYVLSKEPQKKPFIEVLCGKRYAKISLNLFCSNSNTATEQCKFWKKNLQSPCICIKWIHHKYYTAVFLITTKWNQTAKDKHYIYVFLKA